MTRTSNRLPLIGILLAVLALSAGIIAGAGKVKTMDFPVQKTEEEWRKLLTPEQYRVLREKGTERAFTGEYTDTETSGTYVCAGCGAPLFQSDTKFHSGCGWPSFFKDIEGNVIEIPDYSHGMTRTEVVCKNCGGHLGHVFNDGPRPTGLRYCINSVSVKLKPKQ